MFLLFALGPATSALADPVPMLAAEIRSLLTGNTIHGTWSGDEYKQFFNADGSTIYAPRASQSTAGKWRVNEKTNEYESWWERSGWSGYGIVRDGDQLFWASTGLKAQPFRVLPGQQLVWIQD